MTRTASPTPSSRWLLSNNDFYLLAYKKRTICQEFLCTHRVVLAAADFFSVEVWTAWS